MKHKFSEDFEYIYLEYDNGLIEAIPLRTLTDEEKKALYEEIYE